jgi:hypothetical protein
MDAIVEFSLQADIRKGVCGMSLSVASSPVNSFHDLPEAVQLVLAIIDGGMKWVDWAISAPSPGSPYSFPDESTLVASINRGLHGSRFTLLPRLGLLVSPVKLITLGVSDLRVLARAEAGDESPTVAAQTKEVLANHRLVTQADLDSGGALLGELGVAHAPVFQTLRFEERLAIRDLLTLPEGSGPQGRDLQREAAAFAVQQARTPLEFTDYYQVYLQLAHKPGVVADTPEQRATLAAGAVQTLLPLLFGDFDCPHVDGPVTPAQVAAAVSAWLIAGRQVRFARISRGVQQIVQNTGYKGETGDLARTIRDAYLTGAQAFLASATPQRGLVGQDGASCVFPIASGSQQGELWLGPTGIIALSRFSPGPPQTGQGRPAS